MSKFTFIDLFAGIGGFHQAMTALGGECVFASEIDKKCAATYIKNYGMDPTNDITVTDAKDIPHHDVLCAGFPCQAFSNAGHKKGFEDTRGTLFFDIARIIEYHKPKYIFLENVKHLVNHDHGNTWRIIKKTLLDLGYVLPEKPIISSPIDIGVPQNRPRIFILGVRKDLTDKEFLEFKKPTYDGETSIYSVLSKRASNKYKITEYEEKILNAWDVFKKGINISVFGFPVWVDEFGLDYDYSGFPQWKQDYVRKNRQLYLDHKEFIDKWMEDYDVRNFKLRDRKFEWQAGAGYKSVWETSIQFRQSGIRCKKTDFFPALVAMVQIPIVAKYKRRLTPRECARLQSFPEDFIINEDDFTAYKQFGNSLNVELVKYFGKQLLEVLDDGSKSRKRKS
jgi:DNA (cytosine-5)-methyltransferase 1